MNQYTVGIDASNIRAGGGITHLSRLLLSAQPIEYGINKVVVWSGHKTLKKVPNREWLKKIHVPLLDKPLPVRVFWQRYLLESHLNKMHCDALFSPGGTLPFRISIPTVGMSQNLLPFEVDESSRFSPLSFMRTKMALLRRVQLASMNRADGLIFLSRYARDVVLSSLHREPKHVTIIPHGVEAGFFSVPRPVQPMSEYSFNNPFRILYVSTVDVYKHQWNVAKAVITLRQKGFPAVVDFVGGAYKPALKRLQKVIRAADPEGEFLRYRGLCEYENLPDYYNGADVFIFASSCENLPNIVLEAMASGLPIACSNMGPMPEILGDSALYFDPEKPGEIELSLQKLLEQSDLRDRLANEGYMKAKIYSWKNCADETFSFIRKVLDETKQVRS